MDPGFHVSLLKTSVRGNLDVNLNEILQQADPIQNSEECGIERVIYSIKKGNKVFYIVKWKGWPAKKYRI
jgi:hypothetical protein